MFCRARPSERQSLIGCKTDCYKFLLSKWLEKMLSCSNMSLFKDVLHIGKFGSHYIFFQVLRYLCFLL